MVEGDGEREMDRGEKETREKGGPTTKGEGKGGRGVRPISGS